MAKEFLLRKLEPEPPAGPGSPRELAPSRDADGRRLLAYLRRVPLPEMERLETALSILKGLPASTAGDGGAEAMRRLQKRLDLRSWRGGACLRPPLRRSHMTPERFRSWRWANPFAWRSRKTGKGREGPAGTGREYLNQPWGKVARRRRLLLAAAIPLPTATAVTTVSSALLHHGATLLEAMILIVFLGLFIWISGGFCTAALGFFTLLRRIDRVTVTRDPGQCAGRPRPGVRTAILFPVRDEEMDRVMAGVKATYLSLQRTGCLEGFDFYVLSDTGDPDRWVDEETAWGRTRNELGAEGRLFYRRRRVNLKRKNGNVADFCRRYGALYTYMVVMDADSVMAGPTLVRMVAIMERQRHVGILQTAPAVVGRQSYLARVQQFANRLYGPMFAAGLHFVQLGDGQFWGHNAIIRVRPFMKHCALARLPGRPPLGGDILSHDFVEAALMRRAGWGVWLAFDLDGSYEESPPTLLAELKRDRRWCQGNLQHLRLLFTEGFSPVHRALFLQGAMAYVSAFLWFLFLVLSSLEAICQSFVTPDYFPFGKAFFPPWPAWNKGWTLGLLATTGVLLFLPKLLSYLLILLKGRRHLFGGAGRLALSILAEIFTSFLLAPIRMLFHSKFVLITLLGREAGWGRQHRGDGGTTWADAFRFHLGGTVLAVVWGALLYSYNRLFFWWMGPVLFPLLLAVPLSVLTSRTSLGLLARRLGLFLTPEEVAPPPELAELERLYRENVAASSVASSTWGRGFRRAVLDPAAYRLHLALLGGPRRLCPELLARRASLGEKAVAQGPQALAPAEKKELLADPGRMTDLHLRVWRLGEERLAKCWGVRPGCW
ncbi:MAG: glucans biosynthesis glucosyltransferase MdoH [Desulfobacteraceae bacterium]|nr:glucans biosynthesis glucosyltransferase MdoH [Desulfobacteraceae bacterium]